MAEENSNFSIIPDPADMERLQKVLASVPNGANRAMSAAINRTLTTGRVRIARRLHNHINLGVNKIKESMSIHRSTVAKVSGRIQFSRKSVSVFQYGATDNRPDGVTFTVRHDIGEESRPHAFFAMMRNGHEGVFQRVQGEMMDSNPRRQKIREMFGPTVIGAFAGAPGIKEEVMKEMGGVLAKNVQSQITRLLAEQQVDESEPME